MTTNIEVPTTRRWSADAVALTLIALFMLPAGLQAAFAPQSFFDDFPFGRGWISHDGELYNEHLVRDVGGLFLAMIVVTAWTVVRRAPTRGIALGWLVQGILHLAFHIGHLDEFGTVDTVGLIASLGAVPVLAGIALWRGP